MTYRVLIFDEEKELLILFKRLFDHRGYQVFTFPHRAKCLFPEEETCPCSADGTCSDVILSDLNMPFRKGLDFFEDQIRRKCKCTNFALMSGELPEDDMSRAKSFGIKIFVKPFKLKELTNWLDRIENGIDPKRKLVDITSLNGTGADTLIDVG